MATTINTTRLRNPVAPRLPAAPVEYDQRYIEQYSNVLRLYFNQLDSFNSSLTAGEGGAYLNFPYGAFYDTTDQTAASTTVAYPITFTSTSSSNGVSIESSSHIKFDVDGIYNIQFSVQLSNLDNAPQDIDIWFRKNGTDIANSNSRFGLAARKSAGVAYHTVGAVNIVEQVTAGQYIELVWCTTNVNAQIEHYAAGASPTRPAIPSVILTATFVSSVTA